VRWSRAVVCALCLWPSASLAQSSERGNEWFLRTGVTTARIFSDNPFVSSAHASGSPVRWGPNLTVEVGRQTDGSQEWHHLYGIPSWGLGFSLASFSNGAHHTRPIEAYTFFSWPFARLNDRMDLTTDFGMGVSWHWKEFGGETASESSVLGSDLNARIDWGFYLRYATTARTRLYMGADFTHRSNGGMSQPDLGINTFGPRVSLQYNLAPGTSNRRLKAAPPPFTPSWEFVIGGAAGVKNVAERTTPIYQRDFGATVITSAAQRQFYRYGKFAVGTDATYDGSTGARLDDEDRHWRADVGQRWALGAYGGYEHIIGRFGAIAQAGYYVARGYDSTKPRLYQRLGWRYRVSDRLWSTFAIRTTGGRRADALEVGAGYRMNNLPWLR